MRALQTIAALLMLALLAGCRVTSTKNGKNDDVDVKSLIGSMHIKTNDDVDLASVGLTAYPGSTPWKNEDADNKNDHDSADINMSFGDFHLGVKAATLRSTDSQDKILSFYRKDMARYGEVIECKGSTTIGTPTRTSQGLTCNSDEKHNGVNISEGDEIELRAGSEQHMHLVAVHSKDGAQKIGLVALELPTHLTQHNSKDIE